MLTDYYDPSPRFLLSRPIVIGGQLGCGAALIGRSLSARTGLPFAQVDRVIEHEAGALLARIAEREGAARVERWARSVLERIVTQPPCGVIVLDRAWPSIEVVGLLRRRCHFIHVKRSPRVLFDRLFHKVRSTDRWLLGELADTFESEADLAKLLAAREPLLDEAGFLLDAGAQHDLQIAQGLVESIEAVADGVPG